jgi:hypothetical protein
VSEIPEDGYAGVDAVWLRRLLRLRDRQLCHSRDSWVRAAKEALAGDPRNLRNKVDMEEMGPVTITNGKDEWFAPSATHSKET